MTRRRGSTLGLALGVALVVCGPALGGQRGRAAGRHAHVTSPPSASQSQAKPTTATLPPEPIGYCVVAADTDTELAARDADRQWPPASMAKMMTVLLALEQVHAGKHALAESVSVSAHAAQQGGSQVFLKAGETFSLGDLLAAAMIPSANDAAVAVAEHLAGSTDVFVRRMNARARALGMTRPVCHAATRL